MCLVDHEFLLFVLQSVCVEQLTLDFEYLINEVIRSDAAWATQFCSFSDYDVVILEVSTHTHAELRTLTLSNLHLTQGCCSFYETCHIRRLFLLCLL